MADTTKEFDIKEMILHHLADSKEWESPFGVVHLPQFEPMQLGPPSAPQFNETTPELPPAEPETPVEPRKTLFRTPKLLKR